MALCNGSAADNTNETENCSFQQRSTSSLCSRGFYWPVHSPLILFLLFILAANGVEIVLMLFKEPLRTVSNRFLVSLAVSDLLFGVIGIPLFLVCSIKTSILVCVFSTLVTRFTAISSVFHLFLIACDRYTLIVYSMKYQTLFTKLRAAVFITLIWSLALVSSFIQMAWYEANNNFVKLKEGGMYMNKVYFLFVIVVFLFFPLLSMLFMYSHILTISLRHILAVRRRKRNLDQPVASIAHDLRGTFILLTMMLIFIGCWLPFFLLMLQDHISEKFFVIRPGWGLCIILYLRFLPPLTNAVLCAFCKQDFRRAWSSFFQQQRCPIHVNFHSLASVSGTRERTVSTAANEITATEKTNNAQNSSGSLNRIPVEVQPSPAVRSKIPGAKFYKKDLHV